jgi:hypothetical protein
VDHTRRRHAFGLYPKLGMPGDNLALDPGTPVEGDARGLPLPAARSDFPALGTQWHACRRRSSSSFPFLF